MMTSERGSLRRLQLTLALLMLWEAVSLVTEMSFGGPLFKASGGDIGGALGGRGAFSGQALVFLAIYFYGLVRGPLRHPGVLWVGLIEQAAAALFGIYHLVIGDLKVEATIAPVAVSVALLALLLVNMPRNTSAS